MTRGRTVNKQLALVPTQKLIKRNSDKLLSTFGIFEMTLHSAFFKHSAIDSNNSTHRNDVT